MKSIKIRTFGKVLPLLILSFQFPQTVLADCPSGARCGHALTLEGSAHFQKAVKQIISNIATRPEANSETHDIGSTPKQKESRIQWYAKRLSSLAKTKAPGELTYQVLNAFGGIHTEFAYDLNVDLEHVFRKILAQTDLSEEKQSALRKLWGSFNSRKTHYTGNRIDPKGNLIKSTSASESGDGFANNFPYQFVRPVGENGIPKDEMGYFLASFLDRKPSQSPSAEPSSVTNDSVPGAQVSHSAPTQQSAASETASSHSQGAGEGGETNPSATGGSIHADSGTPDPKPNTTNHVPSRPEMTAEDRLEIARMDREFSELQARHEAERRQAKRESLAYDLRRVQAERARLERLVSETDKRLAAIADEPLWGFIPGAVIFFFQQMGDYRAESQQHARLQQQVTELRNQEASLQDQINTL